MILLPVSGLHEWGPVGGAQETIETAVEIVHKNSVRISERVSQPLVDQDVVMEGPALNVVEREGAHLGESRWFSSLPVRGSNLIVGDFHFTEFFAARRRTRDLILQSPPAKREEGELRLPLRMRFHPKIQFHIQIFSVSGNQDVVQVSQIDGTAAHDRIAEIRMRRRRLDFRSENFFYPPPIRGLLG